MSRAPGLVVSAPAGGRLARAYWTTMRPYLFPVSGAAGLVGLASAKDLSTGRLVVASAVFCLAYGLGQALTDVTQTDTDALSAPYRPLVRGEIRRVDVLVATGVGIGAGVLALLAMSPWAVLLALVSVAGLATYTPMKRRFWAGPAHNSWIVALLPAMGALCDGRPLSVAVGSPVVWAAMLSVFFSYATFVLLGYLKDVEADRATGYDTLPVRYGRRVTVAVSSACVPLALFASLVAVSRGSSAWSLGWGVGAAGWVSGACLLVGAQVRALAATRDELAHPAIAACVRGFVALHLAEAVLLRPALCVPAALFSGCFELALANRPCKEQV
jgi:4-hydroxybenzoate polyprenyltransferase